MERERKSVVAKMCIRDSYILVHAGFGIQIVDEQEAQETLELVNTMAELAEEDQLATNPAEAY